MIPSITGNSATQANAIMTVWEWVVNSGWWVGRSDCGVGSGSGLWIVGGGWVGVTVEWGVGVGCGMWIVGGGYRG